MYYYGRFCQFWGNMGRDSSVDKICYYFNINKELGYLNILYNIWERFLMKIFYLGLVYKVLKKYY